MAFDPIEFPRRYLDPSDIEVVGLLSASLAYGRADLFKPKIAGVLDKMGPHPAAFLRGLTVTAAASLVSGFVYRFNVATDLAVLLTGMGKVLRTRGSLEAAFVAQLAREKNLHGALAAFVAELRHAAPLSALRARLGPERGLAHLLPFPLGKGAAKRLNLYLRWMVRGPDAIDFGIWKRVPAASLLIPLDTHIGRIARHLSLTRRNDLSWRTAEEITASLRRLDPEDPVRYDFALCHYGMSGVCPAEPRAQSCGACLLLGSCRSGPAVLARDARGGRRAGALQSPRRPKI